jgi:hypothetical protein
MNENDVSKALAAYAKTADCNCLSHYKAVRDESGHKVEEVELSDAEVCERERKWRQYCRCRDQVIQ